MRDMRLSIHEASEVAHKAADRLVVGNTLARTYYLLNAT
jgi:hypothetical protein